MDKSFEDIFNEVKTEQDTSSQTSDQSDTSVTENAEETENVENNNEEIVEEDTTVAKTDSTIEDMADVNEPQDQTTNLKDDKSFAAFAQMRTQKAELEKTLSRFDAIAQKMGLKDASQLLEQSEDGLLQKEAEKRGMSVDDLKAIKTMENRIAALETNEKQIEYDKKVNTFNVISSSIEKDLSEDQIKNMAKAIKNDYSYDELLEMPSKTLEKVLRSYMPQTSAAQKMLEQKAKAQKEIPLEQSTSKINNTNSRETEIDKLAKHFAGIE